jgi:beta-xylosidase
LVLRAAAGDFVLSTHVEFDPTADRQGAGLFVRGSDGRTVSFGILEAVGPRGTFRGLIIVAERAGGADPLSQFERFDGTAVTLRLERAGNTFIASFSDDGTTFSSLPALQTDLSGAVEVGVGNFVGDNCTARCTEGSDADFEHFQIGRISEAGDS